MYAVRVTKVESDTVSLAPFSALLVFIFVKQQPYCKFQTSPFKKDGREKLFDLPNKEFFERVKPKNAVILMYYK